MEGQPRSGSIELPLEGVWAPLRALDKDCGDKTIALPFVAISNPERVITLTHSPGMEYQGCNVYVFTRLDTDANSFFSVLVDQDNNVAVVSILSVDPENRDDQDAFHRSIELQAEYGLTFPSNQELDELSEILDAYANSQVAKLGSDIENI